MSKFVTHYPSQPPRLFLLLLRAACPPQVGYFATPWGAIYSSSKAAVHSLTDAMRLELKPFGVKVRLTAA